jgi:HK97 family phage major capsid protein
MPIDPILSTSFGTDPNIFSPAVYDALLSAIVDGNPFANSLTRWDTSNSTAVFGVLNVTGAAWINEGDVKPDLATDASSVVVSTSELAGIALISDRAIRDTRVNLQAETQRILRAHFGRTLDDGLLHGNGTPPNPLGVLGIAAAAAGTGLWAAVHTAKGQIVAAGGNPTTLALSPAAVVAEEARRLDAENRPLYPDGLVTFAGLEVVRVPALAATEFLVYDRTQTFFVVGDDFQVTPSRDYAEAYKRDALALRVSGDFAVAVPIPTMAIRKLTVS